MTVLGYPEHVQAVKTYAANRVEEIHDSSSFFWAMAILPYKSLCGPRIEFFVSLDDVEVKSHQVVGTLSERNGVDD